MRKMNPLPTGLALAFVAFFPAGAQEVDPVALTDNGDPLLFTEVTYLSFAAPIPRELAEITATIKRGPRTVDLRDPDLREARVSMLAGNVIAPDLVRALAEAGDGLAAQRYVRWLLANNGSTSDVAYFSAIAAQTGRGATFSDMISALHRLVPGTEPEERIEKYQTVLNAYAKAGNYLAIEAIFDLSDTGKLFPPLDERSRDKLLTLAAEVGDGRIELELAVALMRDPAQRVEGIAQIVSYLEKAASSTSPGVQAAAVALMSTLSVTGTDGLKEIP